MIVHLWYDTTSYLITTGVTLLFFLVAIALVVRSWRHACGGQLTIPTLTALALAMVVYFYPHIPTIAELQSALDWTASKSNSPLIWAGIASRVTVMTNCSAWLTMLQTGFEFLAALANGIVGYGLYQHLTTTIDGTDGLTPAQRWRRNWRINRHEDRITTAIISVLRTHGIESGSMQRYHREQDPTGAVITRFRFPADLTPEVIEAVSEHVDAYPAVKSAAFDDSPFLQDWLTVTWDLETIDSLAAPPLTWAAVAQRKASVTVGAVMVLVGVGALVALSANPPHAAAPVAPRDVASPTRPVDTIHDQSQPAAAPDVAIPLHLSPAPCSPTSNCTVLDGDRLTITLSHPVTITGVSLVPDEVLPGRIITRARWDLYNPDRTPQTAQEFTVYSATKDPGWSVHYALDQPFRASKLALTVLQSVPADPHAGPPPGPAIASVVSLTARPPTDSYPGESDAGGATAAPAQRPLR